MSDKSLFEIDNVARHFEKQAFLGRGGSLVRAVDGVSLTLRKGRTLGLVGESGCGKSTLIRTVLRLDQPTSGMVRYDGRDIASLTGEDLLAFRRKVQMIFQDPYASLNPRMTVFEIVSEPWLVHRDLVPKKNWAKRVDELLGQVGLRADFVDRYPHEMSGGQRQRVGIARALALSPEVLICDEPVSALDVSVQAQVMNLLRDLQNRLGITLLFVSHNLSVVRYISDDIAVMYLGKIVENGPADEVFFQPRHPYTAALVSASPKLHGEKQNRLVLRGDPPDPAARIDGCKFHSRCWKVQDLCQQQQPKLGGGAHREACFFPLVGADNALSVNG